MLEILGLIVTKPHDFNWEWSVKAFLSHLALGYIFSLIFYLVVIRFFASWNDYIFKPGPDSKKKPLTVFGAALLTAFWGGVISVFVDIDHAVLFFGKEYGRPWHKPLAAFAAVVAIFTFARLIKWRLDKSFNHVEELKRVHGNLLWCVLSLCVVLHVAEDYLVKWF